MSEKHDVTELEKQYLIWLDEYVGENAYTLVTDPGVVEPGHTAIRYGEDHVLYLLSYVAKQWDRMNREGHV